MGKLANIFDLSTNQLRVTENVDVLQDLERNIPGSVKYTIKRIRKQPQWNVADTGILSYHYSKTSPEENYLELRFCVSGNFYCREKQVECDLC